LNAYWQFPILRRLPQLLDTGGASKIVVRLADLVEGRCLAALFQQIATFHFFAQQV